MIVKVMLRVALTLVFVLLVAGCAGDQNRWIPDRPNGQPGWLPCMAGDRLCSPR